MTELTPLSGLAQLGTVLLKDCDIADAALLELVKALRTLDLAGCNGLQAADVAMMPVQN